MVEFQFILTYNGNELTIPNSDQPKGLGSLTSTIKRDFDSHGTFFKFTSGDLKLEFIGDGRDFLNNAWNQEGTDAEVSISIQRRYTYFDSWTEIYSGQAIMKNREYTQDFFKVDFEEVNAQTKIISRKDVVFASAKDTNLDGGAMTSLMLDNLSDSDPKKIRQQSSVDFESFSLTALSTSGFPNWSITSASSTVSELKNEIEFTNEAKSISINELTTGTTADEKYSLGSRLDMYPKLGGDDYDVVINFDGSWQIDSATSSSGVILQLKIREVNLFDTGEQIVSETTVSTLTEGGVTSDSFDYSKSYTISKYKPFSVGAEFISRNFYPIVLINPTGGSENATVTLSGDLIISATIDTQFPSTTVKGALIHKILDKNLEYVTGETSFLKSTILGNIYLGYASTGCLNALTETNGYKARGFTRPIKKSLKDRLDGLKAIYPIGYGVQLTDYDKTEWEFRLERFDYYYANDQLASFTEIEEDSYREEYFDGLDFNEVEVGYDKYAEDEDQSASLEDFNTQHNYVLPLKYLLPRDEFNRTQKYSLVSNYIGSDYLYEITRRRQFNQKPTSKWKYDEDVFLIFCNNPSFPSSGVFSVTPSKDTNIENITGITNGDTAFNYEINPRYNFLNHAEIINSALFKKSLNDTIYTNTVENNSNLSFNYKSSYNPCVGDLERRQKSMGDNILIGENDYGQRKFDPIKITFRAAMTTEKSDNIMLGHRNGLNSGNYGYITVLNPDNEEISGWLISLSYNPVDEIGEFELVKKADDYFI